MRGALRGKVGELEINWLQIPRGSQGNCRVQVAGKEMDIRWRRDAEGLWIETAAGVFGFDILGQAGDDGAISYQVRSRLGDQEWSGLTWKRAGEELAQAAEGVRRKGVRVRAQMPGKIIRVLVKSGSAVEKDQPLVVMEAMKMENEIRAPQAGTIGDIKVSEGQAIESGTELLTFE